MLGGKVIGPGSCDQGAVALYSADGYAPYINKEWRILNNGNIQCKTSLGCSCGTDDPGFMCWTRNFINISLIRCYNATAGEESQQTELRRQQFDFQRKWKTEKSGNSLTTNSSSPGKFDRPFYACSLYPPIPLHLRGLLRVTKYLIHL